MNTIAMLDAPVMPVVHRRERSQYRNSAVFPAPRIWPPSPKPKTSSWANHFLRSLPSSCTALIERSLRPVTLCRDEILHDQQALPEYVYFPETAVISHQRVLLDGRTVEIALTGREGTVGMASVFGSGVSTSSAEVAQAGLALKIERILLIKLSRIYPELVPLLAADVGRYINDISCRSICNTYHDLRPRLATWLLMMRDLSGKSAFTLTHEQMSRSLGVFRPSITCTTTEMRLDGLIEYSRSSIILKDRSLLEQAACTCYGELAKGL
ncbi:MAG TPA: Crp/Fnr family transcriptional regulator [Pyrinomonadaceae bacterium]|nr:Crp/Fnr family transcriptional regulator [Pyrinomonadaceae bacterium]